MAENIVTTRLTTNKITTVVMGASLRAGLNGTDGTDGTNGTDGVGVPVGGTAGQVLAKIDATDYNTTWVDQGGGGGGAGTPINNDITRLDNLHGVAGVATNTNVGFKSLNSAGVSSAENTAVGVSALESTTTGVANTAVGYKALTQVNNNNNTAVGYEALGYTAAGNNTGVGYRAFRYSSGSNNAGFGALAGQNNDAGEFNTGVGSQSLYSNDSGNYNSALGYRAYFSGNYTNVTCVGAQSSVTGSNQVQLGDSATTTYVYGTVQNRSDERDKADIRDTKLGLDFIKKLRPVDFRWDLRSDYTEFKENFEIVEVEFVDEDGSKKVRQIEQLKSVELVNKEKDGSKKRRRFHHGLIAQDLQSLVKEGYDFGGLQDHLLNGGEDVLSVGYDELIAPLIKAIQELNEKVETLEAQLTKS